MERSTRSPGGPADDFEEDPRYRVSQREELVCLTYWPSYTALAVAVAWVLGNRDAAEIDFVLGFPDWFFWSAIGVTVLFATIVPYVMVRIFFTDIDLEPRPRGEDPADREVAE